MKYLLIIQVNPATLESLSEAERTEIAEGQSTFIDTITASGEMVGTQALADPSQSAVVRGRLDGDRRPVPGGQGVHGRLLPGRL